MTIPKAWWDDWWKRDWSWEGLAKKEWRGWVVLPGGKIKPDKAYTPYEDDEYRKARLPDGARFATLQDYWRDQESALITAPDGKKQFTPIHLPLAWEDGTPTEKADWRENRLDDAIKKNLNEANTFTKDMPDDWEGDARAQFSGAVFLDFLFLYVDEQRDDGKTPVSISCYHAAFSGRANFLNAAFSGTAHFDSAAFSSYADFQNAAFSGHADFSSAAFSSYADFSSAAFSGHADFQNAAFSGPAYFSSAAFVSYADFNSAVFAGKADFSGEGQRLQEDDASQEIALFFDSAADDGATGDSAAGTGRATGALTTPGGIAPAANRSVRRFSAHNACFLGPVNFSSRDIVEGPEDESSDFEGAKFFDLAMFHGANIHLGQTFAGATFEHALENSGKPESWIFRTRPRLKKIWLFLVAIIKKALPLNVVQKLEKHLWIYSIPESALRNLAQATLGQRPSEDAHKIDPETLDPEKLAQWDSSYNDWRAEYLEERLELMHALRNDAQARSTYFRALEDCFRTLKQFNEERRDRLEEARFFRLELLARSKREIMKRPLFDRPFTWCYHWLSDFGTSLLRPMGVLIGVVLAFALLYALMGAPPHHAPTMADWRDALSFSFGRAFPFGPWGAPDPCGAIAQMLGAPPDSNCEAPSRAYQFFTPVLVKFTATLQSLLAIALFFLSGLALRRRFQID